MIQSQKVRKPEDDEEEKIEYVQPRLNKIVPETFNLVQGVEFYKNKLAQLDQENEADKQEQESTPKP